MNRQLPPDRRALVRRPLVGILGLCACSLLGISLLAQNRPIENADSPSVGHDAVATKGETDSTGSKTGDGTSSPPAIRLSATPSSPSRHTPPVKISSLPAIDSSNSAENLLPTKPDFQHKLNQQESPPAVQKPVESSLPQELAQTEAEVPSASAPLMRRLSHVNWQQFEKSLLSIWGHALQTRREPSGNQVRIILPGDNQTASHAILVDRTNNRVGVEGPSSVLPTLHSVVETLDFPPAQDRGDVQLIGLGSAEPGMVRKAAALLGLQQDPSQNIQQAVRFAPFRKNAGVTLTGARTPAAQQQPENQQQPDQRPNILTVQDETIQGTVRIQVLEDIGAILLVGDPQDVERVKRVIESLQAGAAAARPDIMTYPLQNADSATLQPLLTDIYQNMYEVSSGAVSITALDQPNALVVVGQPQAQEIIAELIQKLDIQMPPDAALDFKVYRLKHMSAPDAALKIRSTPRC